MYKRQPNAIVEVRTPVEFPNTTTLITTTNILAGEEITVSYDEGTFSLLGL